MSEQYEQAVRQRARYEDKSPDWLTFAIIGFIVFGVIVLIVSLFGGSSNNNKLTNEFQKTLFEQTDGLIAVNALLINGQEKNTRYFSKLNKHADQIHHRFEIISEFVENNNLAMNDRSFAKNEKFYRKNLDLALEKQQDLIKYYRSLSKIKQALPKLLAQNTEINNILFKNNASNNHIYYVTRQLFLIERISSNVNTLGSNLSDANLIVTTSDRMARDLALLIRVYSGLLKGDYKMNVSKINNLKVRNELNKVRKISKSLSNEVSVILEHGPEAFQFVEAGSGLNKYSLKLRSNYRSLFFEDY